MTDRDSSPAGDSSAAENLSQTAELLTSNFSKGAAGDRVSDLIAMIKESADKLAQDQTSRGDLKILSRTLRELRYAFKVFSPYRDRRKVTVFGSARTRPNDEITYKAAPELLKTIDVQQFTQQLRQVEDRKSVV